MPPVTNKVELCDACGKPILIGDWPICKPEGGHEPARTRNAATFDPVVIHVAKDGTVRFPGKANARMPAGYERRELTTIREVRQFENSMNRAEKQRISERIEREQEYYSQADSQNRSDLLHEMQSMSPLGRAFAQQAIEKSNKRQQPTYDPGFYVEVFNYDSPQYEA